MQDKIGVLRQTHLTMSIVCFTTIAFSLSPIASGDRVLTTLKEMRTLSFSSDLIDFYIDVKGYSDLAGFSDNDTLLIIRQEFFSENDNFSSMLEKIDGSFYFSACKLIDRDSEYLKTHWYNK
ncbi:MAG: hypothetical protein ABJH72_09280, partial [Reichenbachiella sp.]